MSRQSVFTGTGTADHGFVRSLPDVVSCPAQAWIFASLDDARG